MPTLDVQALVDQCLAAGGGEVALPAGIFDCAPFEIHRIIGTYAPSVRLLGASPTYGRNAGTILRFSGQEVNATLRQACAVISAPGSSIEGISIESRSLSDKPLHGILVRGHMARVRDCSVQHLAGYGIHVAASSADGSNANSFRLESCHVAQCKTGFYVNGAETNAGIIDGCDATANDEYGFFESSFLGNHYRGCHASTNLVQYAQGGSIEDPEGGGVANYSEYDGCYAEGAAANPFRSGQVHISGGNLSYTATGWNGATFPGMRSGYLSKLRFEVDDAVASIPASRALATVIPTPNRTLWTVFQEWLGSPSWLANTVAIARHDKTGWLVPYAATHEGHPTGPGRVVQGTSLVNSPFRFMFRRDVIVTPGSPLAVQIDSDLLKETAGGYLGALCLHAPSILRPLDMPQVTHSDWERVDANSVRTVLTASGPNPVACTLILSGGRAEL